MDRRRFLKLGSMTAIVGAIGIATFNPFAKDDAAAAVKLAMVAMIITKTIASFADGLVRIQVDLNESNLRLNKARGINNSAFPAHIAVLKAGILAGEATIPAGVTLERNLPASIQLTAVPQPNPEDDGPISMGDIVIQCRWPA